MAETTGDHRVRKHAVQAILRVGLRGALFRKGVVNGPWVVRLAGAAGVGLLLASCSFAYVQGPPAGHAAMDDFPCETSFGLPLVDLGVGAGLVIWGITAGETTSDNFGQPVESSATENLVTGLVVGVPFLVGAGWGAREVARCRSARAALAKRAGDAAARLSTRPVPIAPGAVARRLGPRRRPLGMNRDDGARATPPLPVENDPAGPTQARAATQESWAGHQAWMTTGVGHDGLVQDVLARVHDRDR